jgi:hypothetical protein
MLKSDSEKKIRKKRAPKNSSSVSYKGLFLFLLVLLSFSSYVLAQRRASQPNQGYFEANIADSYGDISKIATMSPQNIVTPVLSPSVIVTRTILSPTSIPKTSSPIVTKTPMIVATATPTMLPIVYTSTPLITPTLTPIVSTAVIALSRVVINEIAWMGTTSSATDEWLELYNSGDSEVDLFGWVLKSDTDGSPNIVLSGKIGAREFFLIERTDDQTVSDISANMIASFGRGGLVNTGEKLILADKMGNLVDLVDSSSGWFAGDSSGKISMERVNFDVSGNIPSNWKNNNGIQVNGHDSGGNVVFGTPGQKNSSQ